VGGSGTNSVFTLFNNYGWVYLGQSSSGTGANATVRLDLGATQNLLGMAGGPATPQLKFWGPGNVDVAGQFHVLAADTYTASFIQLGTFTVGNQPTAATMASDGTIVTNIPVTAANLDLAQGQTGTTANVSSASTTLATLTGLSGLTAQAVGKDIVITGAAAGNNGTFPIVGFISATSVVIVNPNSAVDATNAHWTVAGAIAGFGGTAIGQPNTAAVLTNQVNDQ
jgi:hypothetical protein